jgi:predicted amidohydrolase YtcJ
MTDALPLYDRALTMTQADPALTDLRLLLQINKAVTLSDLDRYDEAFAAARQALRLADQTGTVVRRSQAHGALSQLFFDTGRWDDALAEVEAMGEGLKEPIAACSDLGIAAMICFHRGEITAARRHLAAAVRSRIGDHLRAHPGIDWIEGEGWNYAAVPGREPTASMIDEVCAGRPAWLFSYDVHTVWLNTEALRRWGVSAAHPEVPFGTAELDPVSGQPTGWVHDFATKGIHPRGERALAQVLPGYHLDAQYRRLVGNLRDAARFGITTVVEPQNGLDDMALFSRARADGELRSRLIAATFYPPDSAPELLAEVAAAKAAYNDDRLNAGPVKFYIDDVIEPHTAAMLAPYANAPGTGSLYWLVAEWRANVGPARERYAWAMRSLADTGAALAFSSDWNVAEMDPMIGIYTALTRADLSGAGAWNTGEALDLDRTLRAYTYGGAYANFTEHNRGTLRAGKLADVIVLSEDLHQITDQQIPRTTVTHTIVGGQIVHSSRADGR